MNENCFFLPQISSVVIVLWWWFQACGFYTLWPGQNDWHLADYIFKYICILLKFYWTGDKTLADTRLTRMRDAKWHHQAQWVNALKPRQNGRHYPDDILKRIFLNENIWISIKISRKFVVKGLPNRQQAIILTNLDPLHRRIYA